MKPEHSDLPETTEIVLEIILKIYSLGQIPNAKMIAGRMDFKKSTVYFHVKKLEKAGFVKREGMRGFYIIPLYDFDLNPVKQIENKIEDTNRSEKYLCVNSISVLNQIIGYANADKKATIPRFSYNWKIAPKNMKYFFKVLEEKGFIKAQGQGKARHYIPLKNPDGTPFKKLESRYIDGTKITDCPPRYADGYGTTKLINGLEGL